MTSAARAAPGVRAGMETNEELMRRLVLALRTEYLASDKTSVDGVRLSARQWVRGRRARLGTAVLDQVLPEER